MDDAPVAGKLQEGNRTSVDLDRFPDPAASGGLRMDAAKDPAPSGLHSRLAFSLRFCGRILFRMAPVIGLLPVFLSFGLPADGPPAAEERPVRVGVFENDPKVFTSAAGEPEGVFIDIIRSIAETEGWELHFVHGTWAEGLARLSRGEIDLMPDVAFTSERESSYSFHTIPVLSAWDQVYAAPGSGVNSVLDLAGRRIAVLEGSVQEEAFRNLAEGYGLRITILALPDVKQTFAAVASGAADAVVAGNFYGAMHYRTFGLEDTAILFNPTSLYFAAPRNANQDLLEAIDANLRILKSDPKSAYYRSLERWMDGNIREVIPPWLKVFGMVFGGVLVLSLAGSIIFKRQVNTATRSLAERNEQMNIINQALQDNERKYRELVQHANSIILHWTVDGRIEFLNEFGQKFFGYSEQEIIGKHVVGTIVPVTESTGRDLRPLINEICMNPEAFEQNINENIKRNGEKVWIAWTNKVDYDEQGMVRGVLSIGSDITKRKNAEDGLQRLNTELEERILERTRDLALAKERAESADYLKSAFLASMSHELRTPLNSIIGFTGIVLQGLPGPLNDEQRKQLGMVQSSSRHLLDLINDILDLSKIEAGQLDLDPAPFEVRESLGKVMHLIAPLAEKKQLSLRSEIGPEVGTMINDRRRFEQILINLVNNAVKFSEKGGVLVQCGIEGFELVTRVRDTGIGIKPEDMGKLFNSFQQIDSGLTRSHEGSGLGLSICKKLVDMMGGEISVESEWGRGSTFTFVLPLLLAPGETDEAEDLDNRRQ